MAAELGVDWNANLRLAGELADGSCGQATLAQGRRGGEGEPDAKHLRLYTHTVQALHLHIFTCIGGLSQSRLPSP